MENKSNNVLALGNYKTFAIYVNKCLRKIKVKSLQSFLPRVSYTFLGVQSSENKLQVSKDNNKYK